MNDTSTWTREASTAWTREVATPTVAELIEMFADEWYGDHGQGD